MTGEASGAREGQRERGEEEGWEIKLREKEISI